MFDAVVPIAVAVTSPISPAISLIAVTTVDAVVPILVAETSPILP